MRGIRLHHYLDHLLLLSKDKGLLVERRDQVLKVLQDFGWLVNQEKGHLSLMQSLIYLGAQFDMVQSTISLSIEMIPVIQSRISLAMLASHLRASQCLLIMDTMVFTAPVVKWALCRSVPFQKGFLQQWRSRDKN